ncbi:hypothetical protein PAXINDRAFT_29888, partial [Paxillus involutus ATCC 200175]
DGLPREEIMEECKSLDAKPQKKKTSVETLMNSELNQIQEYLHTINQPTWHCGPPTNLGDAEHGKLKAEQWRSSIEFDLLVILCRLWGTMLLAMVIWWGTSYVTSEDHTFQYKRYMTVYLECLQMVFPKLLWRPNHHASLHVGDFLHRYGPMHGWWMFPFERIIGTLQNANTNHKIRELEMMMLVMFCATAKVKVLMQHPEAPKVVRDANNILHQCCGTLSWEAFATDVKILNAVSDGIDVLKWSIDSSQKKVSP